MPLKPIILKEATERAIMRRVRVLQESDIIVDGEAKAEIVFPMYIQLVPKQQLRKFSFGKPEGLRVFIQEKKKIIAAIDFSITGKVLKLMQVHQGPALKMLVKMINSLEKKYSRTRGIHHVELISFLFTRGLYVLVRSGKNRQFFYGAPNRFLKVTENEFKAHIEKTMKGQQDILFEN
jgi:hypothetical protein